MRALALLGALATALAGSASGQVSPTLHTVQLPAGDDAVGRVRDAVLADVNGDGAPDLVVSTGANRDDDEADDALPPRTLRVHLRRDGERGAAFASRPDHVLQLARNVVAFAVADVHANPGAELVLFAPGVAAAAYWADGASDPSFVRIARIRLLWQPASPRVAFAWSAAVHDFDGDGHHDLLVPEPNGYRVLLQRRAADGTATFADHVTLVVPPRPVTDRTRGEARIESQRDRLGETFDPGGDGDRAPLVAVANEVPAPHVVDWDGDGDLDVCAMIDERIAVWLQTPPGFAAAPTAIFDLPERKRSFVNPSYSAQVRDLDGDRRADVVIVSSRTVDDDVSSTVEIYLGAAADGPFAGGDKASDRLRLRGFVAVPTFDDIDGDGRAELSIGSLRTDVIGDLANGGGDREDGRVEAQLNVFRNGFDTPGSGRFKRPVWLVHKVQVEGIGTDRRSGALSRFFRDVDGDGRADLLLRSQRDRLQVRRTIPRGRRLGIGDALWELRVDQSARVEVVARDGRDECLLVRESQQVVLVEFR